MEIWTSIWQVANLICRRRSCDAVRSSTTATQWRFFLLRFNNYNSHDSQWQLWHKTRWHHQRHVCSPAFILFSSQSGVMTFDPLRLPGHCVALNLQLSVSRRRVETKIIRWNRRRRNDTVFSSSLFFDLPPTFIYVSVTITSIAERKKTERCSACSHVCKVRKVNKWQILSVSSLLGTPVSSNCIWSNSL